MKIHGQVLKKELGMKLTFCVASKIKEGDEL
jgi:hypothetical protein